HHTLQPHAPLTRGFDETFLAPHSRYADFPSDVIREHTDLDILVESEEAGAYLFASKDKRLAFVTGHPEYDALTLSSEYFRDCEAGLNPVIPVNYFPGDNPQKTPRATWRSHGHLLFSNWLNYHVYQITPFDLRHMNPTLD
ncbi:homoserine O-acetyltransferase/O-succinyltransferase family protein, partial [Dickeya dianthicola]